MVPPLLSKAVNALSGFSLTVWIALMLSPVFGNAATHSGSTFQFGIDDTIGGLEVKSQEGRRIIVPNKIRYGYLPQAVFQLWDEHYFVGYDVRGLPGSLGGEIDSNKLFRIVGTPFDEEIEFVEVARIPSGVDATAMITIVKDRAYVCFQPNCVVLHQQSDELPTVLGQFGVLEGHELIEIASDEQAAFVLLKKLKSGDTYPASDESLFTICEVVLAIKGVCLQVPVKDIPYMLRVLEGQPAYSVAKTPSEYLELLTFDLNRMKFSGRANLGESNLEGRIAWSGVYYINGLISLSLGEAATSISTPEFVDEAKSRVTNEITHLVELGQRWYPGYRVKRYSMDREPVDFVLHLSRIAKTLELSRPVVGDDLVNLGLKEIRPELIEPTKTVEFYQKGVGLIFRKGAPFWADGNRVPWNYQNAWLEALAVTGATKSRRIKKRTRHMITDFVQSENLKSEIKTWKYGPESYSEGWSHIDEVSFNTPSWNKDGKLRNHAHISYRSMDALAVLALEKVGVSSGLRDSKRYFSELVEKGWLYPFVSEGLGTEQPELDIAIARYYSRSSAPWQLQNQIWVMDRLAD